ncbi:MAG: bifunctional (p)ppGpp synthetase/guanosine-3',5'-bis(diphosphate) 3'-pyrophosphohydrolase, partial [Bacteroidetes bacterium]|nr:bifunctional (p)ppGpp synthetase/guanosine-3',5'-bis(diphosphate) 3'-pyrophosphohydrolase [Bacteroidota bacterium]
TQKARSRVRHWIKENRRKSAAAGREQWEKRARRAGIELSGEDLNRFASKLKFPNTQQMFYEIATGLFDVNDLLKLVRGEIEAETEESDQKEAVRLQFETFLDSAQTTGTPGLLIEGELHTDIATTYAPCCNPIPGDNVFGYISRGGAIKIHRVNCRNAPNLILHHADRVITVEWSRQKDVQFISALRVMGEDRVGLLSDITTVISKNLKTNIHSLSILTEDGVFEGTIVVRVHDLEHLRRLMDRIKRVNGIHGVYRFEQHPDES